MAQKVKEPFKVKEGKYFAPIVGTTDYINGVKQSSPVAKSGVKGTYAIVRLNLPADTAVDKRELYAISTESFVSSK